MRIYGYSLVEDKLLELEVVKLNCCLTYYELHLNWK